MLSRALFLLREAENDDASHELPRHKRPLTPEDMDGFYRRTHQPAHPSPRSREEFQRDLIGRRLQGGDMLRKREEPFPRVEKKSLLVRGNLSLGDISSYLKSLPPKVAQYIKHHQDFILDTYITDIKRRDPDIPQSYLESRAMRYLQYFAQHLRIVGTYEAMLADIVRQLSPAGIAYLKAHKDFGFRIYIDDLADDYVSRRRLILFIVRQIEEASAR